MGICVSKEDPSDPGGPNVATKLVQSPTYEVVINRIRYRLHHDFNASIIYSELDTNEVTIPDYIEVNDHKYYIIGIGDHAFYDSHNIESIKFSNESRVSYFGSKCFPFSNLRKIVIPKFIETIQNDSFSTCQLLDCIEIYDGNRTFQWKDGILLNKVTSELVFCSKSMKGGVKIPCYVKSIIGNAFYGCKDVYKISFEENSRIASFGPNCFFNSGIETIYIPNTIQTFSDSLFAEQFPYGTFACTPCLNNIEIEGSRYYKFENGLLFNNEMTKLYFCKRSTQGSVVIPKSVKIICGYAFQQCNGINNVIIPEDSDLEVIGNFAFHMSTIQSIDLPPKLHTIQSSAFSMTPLENLVLPDSLKVIEESAFYGCKSLSIEIPANVKSIGPIAFAYIKSLRLSESNTNYVVENGIIYNSKKTELLYCCDDRIGDLIIPNTVQKIHPFAFFNRKSINNVCFEKNSNCISIGKYAFALCSIKSIIFPPMLIHIGCSAFRYTSIKSLVFPYQIRKISSLAFESCFELDSIQFERENVRPIFGFNCFMNTIFEVGEFN